MEEECVVTSARAVGVVDSPAGEGPVESARKKANEGNTEAVCEAGAALLEKNAPEADRAKQRVEDAEGLRVDLKELAVARQEALAGARQVHEFDRSADETAAWIAEKESALGADSAPPRSLHDMDSAKWRIQVLQDDLEAIKLQHEKLKEEADRLGAAFPDAKEHVVSKLEDVSDTLAVLGAHTTRGAQQLEMASQLQAYFDTCQQLLAWTNETLARVTAPELAADVSGAERLLARHGDLRAEIDAKHPAFQQLYADGEKLIREGHFKARKVEKYMSTMRALRAALDKAYVKCSEIYVKHLDALAFKRDAIALEYWITTRVPLMHDGEYGESVAQVEELIVRHQYLEETILSQQECANALKRITLVERAQSSRDAESARKEVKRQKAKNLQQRRHEELQRVANQRRRGSHPMAKITTHTPSLTTQHRTQSFRRHQRADPADLPPVEIQGYDSSGRHSASVSSRGSSQHASSSSGESELSAGAECRRERRGVFGGLFARTRCISRM